EGENTYNPIEFVDFSPDGGRIFSKSQPGTLKVWDAATGRLLSTIGEHSSSAALSPDGTRLLSGSLRTVKLWDVSSGQLLRTFEGHAGASRSVAFSPDGTRAISGGDDSTIRIWDIASGRLLATLAGSETQDWLALTPEGFFADSPHGDEILS